ncbi:MAG: tRNA uridine-5-carboxymethylaminomethyl(34) synthesis GTPase MnmE [gamma proteobacterium symbiont of Bathyaustriella thionipta]|nr:tRNA uridine-5-carboxymethylaminomethyl(34) synthesis GTPase MnmE [gamma proteobacterium symbiont of Bathyaustriella thionipta]
MSAKDTIAAQASAAGRAGVGIIRLSGPRAAELAEKIAGSLPTPRQAELRSFYNEQGEQIDQGLLLYFPAPHSFTGEDVIELQAHGGPVIMDELLQLSLQLGARHARPGEFSERAFLNGKLDLAQAEAIADLIDSTSRQAARLASRTLQGEFSKRIQQLQQSMTELRIYVEAAIDFPEEEIDFLSDGPVKQALTDIDSSLKRVLTSAKTGAVMRDGMNLVIAGRPNAGKSSLLNALAGSERAIVTDIPGTTRDILREHIQIDGMPLHILDTAGLRKTDDKIETEGIKRAHHALTQADCILWIYDDSVAEDAEPDAICQQDGIPLLRVSNKIDLTQTPAGPLDDGRIGLSARDGEGLDDLKQALKNIMGLDASTEGEFIARRRHLDALQRAARFVDSGKNALNGQSAGELLAEDLRQAQTALSEITGEFTSDDLLGEIFSSFCIGK